MSLKLFPSDFFSFKIFLYSLEVFTSTLEADDVSELALDFVSMTETSMTETEMALF